MKNKQKKNRYEKIFDKGLERIFDYKKVDMRLAYKLVTVNGRRYISKGIMIWEIDKKNVGNKKMEAVTSLRRLKGRSKAL